MDWLFYIPIGAAVVFGLCLPFAGRRRRRPPSARDFHGWALEQARLLREGKTGQVDATLIAQELERAARAEQDRLDNALISLMTLLYNPPSESSLVDRKRNHLQEVLQRNLSLLVGIEVRIESAWRATCHLPNQNGQNEAPDPTCPFTLEHLLDDRFIRLEKENPGKAVTAQSGVIVSERSR